MPPTTTQALVMLAAGMGMPVLTALNAALGLRLGSAAAAAAVLFAVALLATVAVWAVVGGSVRAVATAPLHLLLAGVLIAAYVLSITWIAPHLGVGNAVFLVLLGQLVSAAVIDHYGLFGARVVPLSGLRTLGIALMGTGVFVTQIVGRP